MEAAKKMDWWVPEEIGHNYIKCKHCYGTGGMEYLPTRKGEKILFVPCPICRGNKELWDPQAPKGKPDGGGDARTKVRAV